MLLIPHQPKTSSTFCLMTSNTSLLHIIFLKKSRQCGTLTNEPRYFSAYCYINVTLPQQQFRILCECFRVLPRGSLCCTCFFCVSVGFVFLCFTWPFARRRAGCLQKSLRCVLHPALRNAKSRVFCVLDLLVV